MQSKLMPHLGLLLQLLLLLSMMSTGLSAKAQNGGKELPKERWEELRKDMEYVERKYDKDKKEEKEEEKKDEAEVAPDDVATPSMLDGLFNATLFKWVLVIILLLVLIGLIFFFLHNQGRSNVKVNKKTQAEVLEQVEENLEEADIPHFLDEALNAGDYQLAIRLYFLKVLQLLMQEKLIAWKRDKTNAEFVEEMADHAHAGKFRQVTRIFEKVWYGDTIINETVYELASAQFEEFMQHFEKKELSHEE